MIIRKAGLWKDSYIQVSKEAGEAILASTPGTMEIPPEEMREQPASLREAAHTALTSRPLNVPETDTSALDRQAGQLRAETDRMKAQTNLAKAKNEYDKSLQQLQQAQQPPQPPQMAQQNQQMQGQAMEPPQQQTMANLTASESTLVQRIKRKIDERRANGQFASGTQVAKPAPKTASDRLHEIIEGKKRHPFANKTAYWTEAWDAAKEGASNTLKGAKGAWDIAKNAWRGGKQAYYDMNGNNNASTPNPSMTPAGPATQKPASASTPTPNPAPTHSGQPSTDITSFIPGANRSQYADLTLYGEGFIPREGSAEGAYVKNRFNPDLQHYTHKQPEGGWMRTNTDVPALFNPSQIESRTGLATDDKGEFNWLSEIGKQGDISNWINDLDDAGFDLNGGGENGSNYRVSPEAVAWMKAIRPSLDWSLVSAAKEGPEAVKESVMKDIAANASDLYKKQGFWPALTGYREYNTKVQRDLNAMYENAMALINKPDDPEAQKRGRYMMNAVARAQYAFNKAREQATATMQEKWNGVKTFVGNNWWWMVPGAALLLAGLSRGGDQYPQMLPDGWAGPLVPRPAGNGMSMAQNNPIAPVQPMSPYQQQPQVYV